MVVSGKEWKEIATWLESEKSKWYGDGMHEWDKKRKQLMMLFRYIKGLR